MSIIDDLRKVPLFEHMLQEGKECPVFVTRGEEVHVASGERLAKEGEDAAFYVVLEGSLQVLKKTDDGEMLIATHPPGNFFGELPLLLGVGFFASGRASEPARVWKLEEEAFWQMLASCPLVTREIMRTMATRTRGMESINQSAEKLISLGTMAAGLAHELNNPAAGALAAAQELKETASHLPALACRLHKQNLGDEQLDSLAVLGRELTRRAQQSVRLSPLERSDREAELSDWMFDRDWKCADEWAATLLGAGVSSAEMDEWETRFGSDALEPVVAWMVGNLTLEETAGAISEATRRIGDIVERVKKYSHLDQSPLGSFDVRGGIETTLKMLAHKLRPIRVEFDWPADVPQLYGYEGELNQVWTNLLDNAADALADTPNPRIDIRARRDGENLVVEVVDNGPGLPESARLHLLEPFFTTKPVGKGTGLGLAISHRVVTARHGGDLSVQSKPGETRFRLSFPLERPEPGQGKGTPIRA